ncbi:MAG TPA: Na-translocating system protein MpsC family protein [Solirubrobacteraceae bacterium]|nr:Na-translocating system protein MpsC family protein [Solirubrobacteraceae bacterium]
MRILPPAGDEGPVDGAESRAVSGSPLLEICNATVRLYKAAFGRGPTHARARFAGSETLVVLLQDTMTASERQLAALGEHERLRAHRLLLHKVVEDEIRSVVERVLERPTLSLISGLDTHRDVAAEVILLAPPLELDLDGPSPGSAGGAGHPGVPPIA